MFCSKCGNEVDNDAMICPKCGCATANMRVQKSTVSEETDTLATCAIIFAILLPIVGLILGIIGVVKYKTYEYKKKSTTAIILSCVILVVGIVIISSL